MRLSGSSDLLVDVEGVGRFVFARRTMRDTYRIRGEYNALTSGNFDAQGNYADIGALAFVSIECLLVKAPEGFTLDAVDPLTQDPQKCEEQIMAIFIALREKEASFRPKPAPALQKGGEGDSAELRGGVSPSIQPATD